VTSDADILTVGFNSVTTAVWHFLKAALQQKLLIGFPQRVKVKSV